MGSMQKIILYYKFVPVADPTMTMRWQREVCQRLNLQGRVIISEHGINGTLGGELDDVKAYVREMNLTPQFDARRMLDDYARKLYDPSHANWMWMEGGNFEEARSRARWNARVREVSLPLFAFIPSSPTGPRIVCCSIPIDDETTAQWYISYDTDAPLAYNILVDFGETSAVVIMALTLSFLATLYPSWRAARLDPVDALRYEM